MKPFDFMITFFSLIYGLALTHLLLSATRMIRFRRRTVFSLPHALWMIDATLILVDNWLSLWDFHTLGSVTLATVAGGFVFVMLQYLICALVSPEFEGEGEIDLRAFHAREGPTYLAVFLILCLFMLALNAGAGSALALQNCASQNALVLAMIAPIVLALLVRRAWAQLLAPVAILGLCAAFPILYYPALR